VRLSCCEVRDHMNYRRNDRWPAYRFYRALQRLKSPMRYICEIFGAPQFSSFQHNRGYNGRAVQAGTPPTLTPVADIGPHQLLATASP
jgi:hypothetical protein